MSTNEQFWSSFEPQTKYNEICKQSNDTHAVYYSCDVLRTIFSEIKKRNPAIYDNKEHWYAHIGATSIRLGKDAGVPEKEIAGITLKLLDEFNSLV